MQAFKAFYKIVPRKFLVVFMIYTLIFVGIMAFFSYSESKQTEDAFELSKVRVSVINHDNSPLANELEAYINGIARPVDIKTDEESIKDALFFRETEFIVTIPEGFQNSFSSPDPKKINTMSVPDSTSSHYARTIIDKYLNAARLYFEAFPEMSIEEINERVLGDISQEANVSFLHQAASKTVTNLNGYFNFLSYILIAMLISMVGRVMLIFNDKQIKMRNYCAPVTSKSYSFQLLAGNLSIAIVIWLIFVGLPFFIFSNSINQVSTLMFVANSFVLTILCLCISFFVASFATKKSIDPIANCFSLGLSFLAGSFVPQALLSDTLKTLGNFNPIFWYVKVNNTIGDLTIINQSTLKPIFYGILVQLAFSFAFLAIALVIIKQKKHAL
ncbi:ABC transporter permease [Alkalicella caledoniensis]|uniref:ABC transporter permease n=1 Tax=Alkalicella caledoniensis TaxID=2731377 RepID=A0A7G9WB78_ALKCA|nr:ABC transporter permease [Alkalicella caledoniensis]QNO15940.1 ABC transporter permease [Alkalicella caledoniensis]